MINLFKNNSNLFQWTPSFSVLPTWNFITSLFTRFALNKGLGSGSETQAIDIEKRKHLIKQQLGQEISFPESSSNLEGMFFKVENAKKTVLLCTGSHSSYEKDAIPMIRAFRSMDCNVMAFNYAGFGKSQGKKTIDGISKSVEAAYQYLHNQGYKDKSIVVWGYSLGGYAAADVGTRHPINVVIDRGFCSMDEVAYTIAPLGLRTIAKAIFQKYAPFNTIEKIKKCKGVVYIAQGRKDLIMVKDIHGKKFEELTQEHPNNIKYYEVDSYHTHDNKVWFSKDSRDRPTAESFVT
jgi:alpha/beta superfamily hydrolase